MTAPDLSPRPERDTVPISVVIPTFNRADLLVETLECCRRRAGGVELEFIVIDDGSTDDTAKRLAELSGSFPELSWRSGPNRGAGQARNLGASLARHDVVLFMGDDIQPQDDFFFRAHAELHAQRPERDLAVLGKVIWPDRPDIDVNFVMTHVDGRGGEQFGYSDLMACTVLDWRFFYTANVSVKKSITDDWLQDGFSEAFTSAAWEDIEFAYRQSKRGTPLRIFYTPASLGSHHHHFSVQRFMDRQTGVGLMARVFIDLHPEVAGDLAVDGVMASLQEPGPPEQDLLVADSLAVLEGVKAWARLIEARSNLGSQHWHADLLRAVFHLCYLEGFIASSSSPDVNLAAAYRYALEELTERLRRSVQVEFSGYALGAVQAMHQRPALVLREASRLRNLARRWPILWKLRRPYRFLRRLAGSPHPS